MIEWNKFVEKDRSTWPTESGVYAVRVRAKSTKDLVHHAYGMEYTTFAFYMRNNYVTPTHPHTMILDIENDEDLSFVVATYGPLDIPECPL